MGKEVFAIITNLGEDWKDIYYNGKITKYRISRGGKVLSLYNYTLIKPYILPNGYCDVQLHINKKIYHKLLHRLVAEAFIPNPENKPQVNHKDGNKLNCWDWNLEWATGQENMDHAIETGLIDNKGENNPNNSYSEELIHKACKLLELGKGSTEISNTISISKDTIDKIKCRDVWKNISDQYNIPYPKDRIYSERPIDTREKIISLIKSGITDNGQILLKVGLPDIRRNRKYVTNINIALKSKVKSSTTIPWAEMPTGVGPSGG